MSSTIEAGASSEYGALATYDLVDGHMVPREMGNVSNRLALRLAAYLLQYVESRGLGFVATECIVRMTPGGVPRRPNVFFVNTERFDPETAQDKDPWEFVPNLAVEVISKTNTVNEIEEKMEDYFEAGVESVWVVSNRVRRISVYTSMKNVVVYEGDETVDAAPLLSGLTIPLQEVYARLGV